MNNIDEKIEYIEKEIKDIKKTIKNLIILVGFGLITLGIMCYVLSYRIKEIIDFIWEIDRVLRPLVS